MEDIEDFSKEKDNEIEEEIEEEIEIINDFKEKRIMEKKTLPVMTIYEKVRFLEERVIQLNENYKTLIDPKILKEKNLTSSIDIAIEEFNTKNFPPISIKRNLPNGNYEIWEFKEFEIIPE